jgi:hypothetical protein
MAGVILVGKRLPESFKGNLPEDLQVRQGAGFESNQLHADKIGNVSGALSSAPKSKKPPGSGRLYQNFSEPLKHK